MAVHTDMPRTKAPLGFLDLPGEIRNKIYELLLDGIGDNHCYSSACTVCTTRTNNSAITILPFVVCCPQIRAEFPKEFFTDKLFVLNLDELVFLLDHGLDMVTNVKISLPLVKFWNNNSWRTAVDIVPLIKLRSKYPQLIGKFACHPNSTITGPWSVGFASMNFDKVCWMFWKWIKNPGIISAVKDGAIVKFLINVFQDAKNMHNAQFETKSLSIMYVDDGAFWIAKRDVQEWMKHEIKGPNPCEVRGVESPPKWPHWLPRKDFGCGRSY